MHIEAHQELGVVALEDDDSVPVMLDLEGPASTHSGKRPEHATIVVRDRSSSMSGSRLTAARQALVDTVNRLDEDDPFGSVEFGSRARSPKPSRLRPVCGSGFGRIEYGMPDPELIDAHKRGKLSWVVASRIWMGRTWVVPSADSNDDRNKRSMNRPDNRMFEHRTAVEE